MGDLSNKVVIVCTQMEAGGVQVLSHKMQRFGAALGVDIKIVFLYKKRPVFEDGESVVSLLNNKPGSVFDYLKIFYRLYLFLKRERADVVVGFAHYSSPIACFFAKILGYPHRLGTQTTPPYVVNKYARILDLCVARLGGYTSNIAASKYIGECFFDYPDWYTKKLDVVYNGVLVEAPVLSRKDYRSIHGIPDDAFLVLNSGRLSDVKNQSFILDLISKSKKLHFAVAGGGELKEYLLNYAKALGVGDRFYLVGELDAKGMANFLNAGDLYLFPSKYEAFGVALVEAMAAGLPVIVNDFPALREVVEEAGLVLDLDNQDLWINAINSLCANKNLREIMGNKSRLQAEKFSMGKMFDGFFKDRIDF